MKKIFVLMTLLTTTFVCAQDEVQEDKTVVTEENLLACDCVDHEEKEVTNESSAEESTLASVDGEVVKEEEKAETSVSILACGSSSCTHGDKDKK